jgi:hypothetical protein
VTGAVDVWNDPDLVELVRKDAPLVAIADALAEGAHARKHTDGRRPRMAIVAAAVVLVVVAGVAPAVALSKSLQTLIGLAWSHPVRIPAGPQIHATLTSHIPITAPAGTWIRISWTLWSRNGKGQVVPFDSGAVFVQIVNRTHTAASTASAHSGHGRYAAIVPVPRGGIGHIQIGINAERFAPTGTHPARFFFPITNSP